MASGPCAPHQQVEHMAAPTDAQCIKKTLANGEPSTHGAIQTKSHSHKTRPEVAGLMMPLSMIPGM